MRRNYHIGVGNALKTRSRAKVGGRIAVAVVLLLCVLSLSGCKQQQTIVQTHDTSIRDNYRTEYVHDTVTIDRWHTQVVNGDTIYIIDSIAYDRWHIRTVTDSVHTSDTIQLPPQLIEKELSGWQTFILRSGYIFWVIVILCVIAIVIKFAK